MAGKNDSLKMLAVALAEAAASVRYDKRGVGESAALKSEADLRLDHYVDDARQWIELLAKDQRFRGARSSVTAKDRWSACWLRGSRAAAFVSISGAGEPAAAISERQPNGRLPPDLARATRPFW